MPQTLHSKRINIASSVFAVAGFILSKAEYFFGVSFIRAFFTVASLVCFLIYYILWFAAATFFPNVQTTKPLSIFDLLKEHRSVNIKAAIVGVLGTILYFSSFALPVLTIPAVWLYFISSCLWFYGEYKELNKPSLAGEGPLWVKHKNYVIFSGLLTFSSLLSAISSTAIFWAPTLAAPPITITFAVIGALVGCGAIAFWLAHFLSTSTSSFDLTESSDYSNIFLQLGGYDGWDETHHIAVEQAEELERDEELDDFPFIATNQSVTEPVLSGGNFDEIQWETSSCVLF